MTLATGFSGTVDGDPIDISVALSSYDQTSIVFVVTVNDVPIEDGQTVLLSYDADVGTITSTDGVALASFTDFPVTNASTVEIPHITASSVSANGSQVTFTFDRAVTGFSTTGFTITASGDPVTLYTAVLANDGLSGYLVVDAIYDDAVVAITHDEATTTTVSVASGTALRDYTTASATNNSTRQPPTVVSASASADGRHVDIRLSERVSGTPGTGWTLYDTTYARTVTIDSGVFTTNDVTDDGVRLTTSTTIYVDSLLTLAYSSASGDIVSFANPLVEMATFTGASVYVQSTQVPVRIVEADSFVAADGFTVTIGLNQSVSGTAGLGFSFTVDGDPATFANAAWADARTMTVELDEAIFAASAVVVVYDDGVGDIVSGIREMFDDAGSDVANNSEYAGVTPESLFGGGDNGWVLDGTRSSFCTDVAGTVPCTSSGVHTVAYLSDLSGNGNHHTQSTAGFRPTFFTDGSTKWLVGTANRRVERTVSMPGTTTFTRMQVVQRYNNSPPTYAYLWTFVNAGDDMLAYHEQSGGVLNDEYALSIGATVNGTGITESAASFIANPRVVEIVQDGVGASTIDYTVYNLADMVSLGTDQIAGVSMSITQSQICGTGASPGVVVAFDFMINRVLSPSELSGLRAWVSNAFSGWSRP